MLIFVIVLSLPTMLIAMEKEKQCVIYILNSDQKSERNQIYFNKKAFFPTAKFNQKRLTLENPFNANVTLTHETLNNINNYSWKNFLQVSDQEKIRLFSTALYMQANPKNFNYPQTAEYLLDHLELDDCTKQECNAVLRCFVFKSTPKEIEVSSLHENSFCNFITNLQKHDIYNNLKTIELTSLPCIEHINSKYMQEIWKALPNLRLFKLNNSQIKTIPTNTFMYFPNHATCDLSDNQQLTNIEPNICDANLEGATFIFNNCSLTITSIINIKNCIDKKTLTKQIKNCRASSWNTIIPAALNPSIYVFNRTHRSVPYIMLCIMAANLLLTPFLCSDFWTSNWKDKILDAIALTFGTLVTPLPIITPRLTFPQKLAFGLGNTISLLSFHNMCTLASVNIYNITSERYPQLQNTFIPTKLIVDNIEQ